jgi:hypothetical protein
MSGASTWVSTPRAGRCVANLSGRWTPPPPPGGKWRVTSRTFNAPSPAQRYLPGGPSKYDRAVPDSRTILVTACGAPGAARLLRALRDNGEREVRLVGVDMSERAIGRHLCDAFHLVPAGADPTFPDALLKLVEQEGVDVVLP